MKKPDFGFDSFTGFGELSTDDAHPFYTDENFATDLARVEKRVRSVARGSKVSLVPGFFSQSLKDGPGSLNIDLAKIIFVDSDTYSSSDEALRFCDSLLQTGTYLILDDFYSYRGSESRGSGGFNEFVNRTGISVRRVFT